MSAEFIELELRPIPPDTLASAKQEVLPLVAAALREAGQEQLLNDGHIQVEVEKTFPTDEAIIVGLTFLAGIGIETYKFMLDVLRERFEVKERSRGKHTHKKKQDD
jgi:hypothetical protein